LDSLFIRTQRRLQLIYRAMAGHIVSASVKADTFFLPLNE